MTSENKVITKASEREKKKIYTEVKSINAHSLF